MKPTLLSACLLILTSLPGYNSGVLAQGSLPKKLDTYVERVLAEFEVPGIALAIVKDGQVLLAKGYGVRQLGAPAPVDSRTLFGIASNTKAFTATALALLVEEGTIEWDTPVIEYLPWFRLSDPFVTQQITVRDLLVHRSGLALGAGDLLWWPASDYTRDQIVRRIRHLPLATSFRSAYAYDNVLYLVAGEVIEAVSGQSWEAFVEERILKKIGMDESNVWHSDATKQGNVATTHARVGGTVRAVAPFTSDNTNPAGGINSSARDMAKWLTVQLDSGRLADGERLFSEKTAEELWTMVTPIPIGEVAAGFEVLIPQFNGYALGFRVQDYRGQKVVSHTGGLPGYVSKVTMLPGLDLGIAVLTNQESGLAFNAITYHIMDHYLGARDMDWFSSLKEIHKNSLKSAAVARQQIGSTRDSTSKPSLPLKAYAGTYTDPWYGDIVISRKENGSMEMRFSHTPSLSGKMEHWQYNTFRVQWYDRTLRADAFITFSLNADGTIDQGKMEAVSPSTDFSFDFHHLVLKPSLKEDDLPIDLSGAGSGR